MNSVQKDFEAFMDGVRPWRAEVDRLTLPADVIRARRYQDDTDALADALRSGDRVRLEAAMFAARLGSPPVSTPVRDVAAAQPAKQRHHKIRRQFTERQLAIALQSHDTRGTR